VLAKELSPVNNAMAGWACLFDPCVARDASMLALCGRAKDADCPDITLMTATT
jgi:hypothetical protein